MLSSDVRSEFRCDLSSAPGPRGEIAVLRVAGDIDLRSLREFAAALAAAANGRAAALVVDLTAVSFCSARGFALLAAALDGRSGTVELVVCGMSPALDRIATLLHPEPDLVRYRSAHAAMAALGADRPS